MRHYEGNQQVESGIYLHSRSFHIESHVEEGPLPGNDSDRYYRIPPVALLIVGPVLGLVYAIFLPVVGFVMLGKLIATKATDLALGATRASLRVLRPSWQPSMAFLGRSKQRKDAQREDDSWSRDVEERLAGDKDEDDLTN